MRFLHHGLDPLALRTAALPFALFVVALGCECALEPLPPPDVADEDPEGPFAAEGEGEAGEGEAQGGEGEGGEGEGGEGEGEGGEGGEGEGQGGEGEGGEGEGGEGEGGEGEGPFDPNLPADCRGRPYGLLLQELVGFGAGTTGGDPTLIHRVTTLASDGAGSLREGAESDEPLWIVFEVDGVIDLDDEHLDVQSHKTIDGRGRDITVHGEIRLNDPTVHVVLSDIAATWPESDVISVRGDGGDTPEDNTTHHLWFHHIELFEGGDGLLDIRGGSLVTISHSLFHRHAKGLLLGNDMDNAPNPGMHITMHHNFFDTLSRRGPQFKAGKLDYFNNHQLHWYEFGAASLGGAQMLSEANIFEARPGTYCIPGCPDPWSPTGDSDFVVSKDAVSIDVSTDDFGFVRSVDDLLLNDAEVTENEPGTVFTRPYNVVIEPPTAALAETIDAEAGPRRTYCD